MHVFKLSYGKLLSVFKPSLAWFALNSVEQHMLVELSRSVANTGLVGERLGRCHNLFRCLSHI